MAQKKKDLKIIEGNTDILLIAPHAPVIGKIPKNDRNTGIIAEQLQKALKCSAIINEAYRKPLKKGKPDLKNKRLDFNIIEHAKLNPTFLDAIKNLSNSDHKTLVVWIHGLADSSAKYESRLKSNGFNGNPNALHALIGYGQGPNPKVAPNKRKAEDREDRLTATKETVENFRDLLIKKGLTTILARENASNFRGRDPERMNQWFRNEGYKLTQVESIQLEIREEDFRDQPENCRKAAKIIEQALSALIRPHEQDTKLPNEKQKPQTEAKAILATEKVKPNVDESNRVETSDDTQLAGGRPYQAKMRKIAELRPHPLNREIYGDPNPDDGLKISIQKNGILTPLIISGDDTIVSGHRRFSGAKECGIEQVPVIIMPPCDDLDIEETLIVANTQRQKTNEQIAREYEKLKIIEGEKSIIRMSLAGGDRKSKEYKKSLTQNSAGPISKGESRKKASARLGISHDTAEKALKVVNLVDELKAEGKTEQAQKLLDILNNKSVNSAYKNVKAISEDPDKAGSLVNEEQTPANNIPIRPKAPPLDNGGNFEDSYMIETIPQKEDIEKLEFDQLKQLESEVALLMNHIHEQMQFLNKQLHILEDCVETISDVLHDKSNDTEGTIPLESNGTISFSPIKSNYADINAWHRTKKQEVPPGIKLIPLAERFSQDPAAAADNDEV